MVKRLLPGMVAHGLNPDRGRQIFGSARQLGVHGQFQASWSYRETLSQKEKNDLRWEARLSFF